jgi:hypothetical protein
MIQNIDHSSKDVDFYTNESPQFGEILCGSDIKPEDSMYDNNYMWNFDDYFTI